MLKRSLFLIWLFLISSIGYCEIGRISGKVTFKKDGSPIIGANVYVQGTTNGTATNNRGEFELRNATEDQITLVISCLGYKRISQKIDLTQGTSNLNFKLGESEHNLGEVVVTGTGTPYHIKKAPVQTELLDKKLIKAIAAPDFAHLMSSVSPSFDFNPNIMGNFMTINGLGNDYILILVDGKRLYGDLGGQTDLSRINPDNIERIEVVKGASSSLYGSEAIAGVINVITKKSKRAVNASNSTRVSDYNTLTQNNNIDLNVGRLSSHTSFSKKYSDGWQLSTVEEDDGELVPTDAKAQNEYTNYTLTQELDFALSDKLNLFAGGSYFENDIRRPSSVKAYGLYFEDLSYSAGGKYLINKSDFVTVNYNSDRFKYYKDYTKDYKSFVAGDKPKQNDQKRSALELKWVKKFSKNNRLSLGAERINERMISDRVPNGEADAYTISAYAQDEMKFFDQLFVVAGLRYVNHEEFGDEFNPKVTAMYNLNDFNFRLNYANGFKAPTMKELYYRYESRGKLYLGNKDLDPQKSNYYAASVEYNPKNLSFSATAYKNYLDNMIDYENPDPSDKKTFQQANIAEATTQGVDVLFEVKLPYNFTLGGGYSYVNAQNETDDIRLRGVAENYGNVRLQWDHKWKNYLLNTSLLGRFQDEKFYTDGNAKAYDLWKFTTTHRFITFVDYNLELTLGVDNIFDYVDDSPYGSHYGTINPGRSFFAGVNINFSK